MKNLVERFYLRFSEIALGKKACISILQALMGMGGLSQS
jgi:hypothetical protein